MMDSSSSPSFPYDMSVEETDIDLHHRLPMSKDQRMSFLDSMSNTIKRSKSLLHRSSTSQTTRGRVSVQGMGTVREYEESKIRYHNAVSLMQSVARALQANQVSSFSPEPTEIPHPLTSFERSIKLETKRVELLGTRPSSPEEELELDVRRRAILRQNQRRETMLEKVQQTHRRTLVAENRRVYLEQVKNTQVRGMWSSVMCTMAFAMRMQRKLQFRRAVLVLCRRLIPMLKLKRRLMWRRMMSKKVQATMARPTVEQLKGDKMFKLFGDDHLALVIPLLTPRFSPANEIIIHQGADSHECYIIAKGSVEILARANKDGEFNQVAILDEKRPVFGTGMIAGEPRMASVRTLEDCYLWVLRRTDFEAAANNQAALRPAMAIVREMHEANIHKLYASQLSVDGLTRFTLLRDAPPQDIEKVVQTDDFKPHALKAGDTLYVEGERSKDAYLVLRGALSFRHRQEDDLDVSETLRTLRGGNFESTVFLEATHTGAFGTTHDFSPQHFRPQSVAEKVAAMCDTIDLTNDERMTLFKQCSSESFINKHPDEVARVANKVFLGLGHCLLGEPVPYSVVCVGNVDVVRLKRSTFMSIIGMNPSAAYATRQKALQQRACWIPPLKTSGLVHACFQHVDKSATFLQALRTAQKQPGLAPFILDSGERMAYDANSRDVILLTSGSLESQVISSPTLWPPLPIAYYGCSPMWTKVTHRVEGFRTTRKHIVDWIQSLPYDHHEAVMRVFAEQLERLGRKPPEFVPLAEGRRINSFGQTVNAPSQDRLGTVAVKPPDGSRPNSGTRGPRLKKPSIDQLVQEAINRHLDDPTPTPSSAPTPPEPLESHEDLIAGSGATTRMMFDDVGAKKVPSWGDRALPRQPDPSPMNEAIKQRLKRPLTNCGSPEPSSLNRSSSSRASKVKVAEPWMFPASPKTELPRAEELPVFQDSALTPFLVSIDLGSIHSRTTSERDLTYSRMSSRGSSRAQPPPPPESARRFPKRSSVFLPQVPVRKPQTARTTKTSPLWKREVGDIHTKLDQLQRSAGGEFPNPTFPTSKLQQATIRKREQQKREASPVPLAASSL